jgi:hypothetical protein
VENGAIIVIGATSESRDDEGSLGIGRVECVEVVGRSSLERMVERFGAIGIETISILVNSKDCPSLQPFRGNHANVSVQITNNVQSALKGRLATYSEQGIRNSFVSWGSAYVETDLLDLLCFHQESKQVVTPTLSSEGPLPLWVVDCFAASQSPLANCLQHSEQASSRYFVREYASCLEGPRDLRRFAADILTRRCQTHPSGQQVRPGVWIDQGADVHRRARIVAPAYIGCDSRIKADALITRLSNVERDCLIESGTVIEDSSILDNTSVGICLDVCHSVASGNRLLNLERDVVVEILDSRVMRSSIDSRNSLSMESEDLQPMLDLPVSAPVPDTLATGEYLTQE